MMSILIKSQTLVKNVKILYLGALDANHFKQIKVKALQNASIVLMDCSFLKVMVITKIKVFAHQTARVLINPTSMEKFLRCGDNCQSCNQNVGCEICPGEEQLKGWTTAIHEENLDYSLQSEFQTCQECKTGFECGKCSKNDITQCKQCNYPVNQKSLLTGDTINPCASQSSLCLDAFSENNCKTCNYGYDLFIDTTGNQKCVQCNNDSLGLESQFIPYPIRCNFTIDSQIDMPKQDKITACLNGFVDPLTNKCTENCGIGRYGYTAFNDRGMIDASVCKDCDDNCFECATQKQCISCKKGYYLSTESNYVTTGKCLKKSGTSNITIYVDSDSVKKSTDETTGLSLNDPFYSIQSAITKAYEYGASYENAIVNIILVPGKFHSMLRYDDAVNLPRAYDQNSQSTIIKIDTMDGTQVKVLYKLRDKFNFLVGGGLEIRNIVFDATDSILDSRFTSLNISHLSSNEYTCLKDPLINCCSISKDQTSGNYVTTGPDFCQLQLQPNDQCHLPIGGSLIQFDISSQTSLGSPQTLILQNVGFENFAYDFNTIIELNDFGGHITLINTSFININSCGSVIRNKRIDQIYNSLEEGFLSHNLLKSLELMSSKLPSNGIFSNICGPSSTSPCFSLNISGGTIQDFGRMNAFSQTPQWVNPQLKMKNMGLYLDLENFQGPIFIQQVEFINNLAVNLDYEQATKILQNQKQERDQQQNYGIKSSIQLRSLIAIVNHGNYKIEIKNNDFNQNTGAKARGLQLEDVYFQTLDSKQELCLGYEIKNNKFIKNFGFQGISGGSIHFECTNFQMEEDANGLIQLDSIIQEDEIISNNLSLENLELEDYSLTLEGNTYIDNTASKSSGILNIINVKKIKIQNETYINNTDAFFQKSTILARNMLQEYMPLDASKEINIDGIDIDQNLAASLIRIQRSRYLSINSINFDSNYFIEPESSINRAQALFLTEKTQPQDKIPNQTFILIRIALKASLVFQLNLSSNNLIQFLTILLWLIFNAQIAADL
ncbi:UNKNOWN [Stylonychia lemnae]|uniref:Uncharacterized protein n=1 Tax=Stylonychia lemnae TaxID=5949 RepID=A0A078B3B6_STYLE|nr:UNKNOWN [Stylonychia lemnae]|eukprot:CDW87732.1 UNKNOWN [Stylonychia lemnae]